MALLEAMLQYNPAHRITPAQALEHAYFKEVGRAIAGLPVVEQRPRVKLWDSYRAWGDALMLRGSCGKAGTLY